MNEDLKLIKKLYGEHMMHFCRTQFSTLLEEKGLLSKILTNTFEPNRFLYEDLNTYDKLRDFTEYIYSFIIEQEINSVENVESPEKLMLKAGYKLYECKTEEDIQKFRKYFAKNEELCTFKGERLNSCHVFFAVKKNADQIKREDFLFPKRQDEYGTSVISIQFTKDGSCTLSIKNRYNHTVANPDATFSNNLDNIIKGLTESFAKHYNLRQKFVNQFEMPGYIRANDGKYYKYNHEINNVYYCANNIIIDNFEVKRIPKDKYLLLDYFILDLQAKKIKLYDEKLNDSFVNCFYNIKKIEVKKRKKEKEITIYQENNQEPIKITVNKYNQITSLIHSSLPEIGHNFLRWNKNLENIDISNVRKIGDYFLASNDVLINFKASNLVKLGHFFFASNRSIIKLQLESLKEIGDSFLRCNKRTKILRFPNLIKVGNNFMSLNQDVMFFEAPNLEEVGDSFLSSNQNLGILNFPKLRKIGNEFLCNNDKITVVRLPNLEEVGNDFLRFCKNLFLFEAHNLKKVGDAFLYGNQKLIFLDLPNLEEIGSYFLYFNSKLKILKLLNVKKIGDRFLYYNQELVRFLTPLLRSVGDYFLFSNQKLLNLDLPNIEVVGNYFFYANEIIQNLNLPNLRQMGKRSLCKVKKTTILKEPHVYELIHSFPKKVLTKNIKLTR